MNTKDLKIFDLEAAKRGDKLMTADGRKVTEFHRFETLEGDKNAIIINGAAHRVNDEGIISTGDGGKLFMAPIIIEKWQNVYNGHFSGLCNSKEDADARYFSQWRYEREPDDEPANIRTHYLISTWSEEGVIQSVELIPASENKCKHENVDTFQPLGNPVVCFDCGEEL